MCQVCAEGVPKLWRPTWVVMGDTVQGVARGRLVTIEGLDGAGKSTLASSLAREIARAGRAVELLREPGGVPISERLRALVKDPALTVSPRAEALLYAAARAQLVHERLTPLLERGTFVLLDRFVDSSLAYQGAGRALGVEEVRSINLFATGGLTPDRTLLLRISPSARRARLRERANEPDRLELEDDRFFAEIASAYDDLARAEPSRIRALDAAQPPERVLREAIGEIEDLLVLAPEADGT
jgi:dTMP kinase